MKIKASREFADARKLFFSIPYLIFGSLLLFDPSSILSILGLFLLLCSILIRWLPLKEWLLNFYFSGAVFFFLLIAIELVMYSLQSNYYAGFNKSCSVFDPVAGYRWFGKDIRMVRFAKGVKIYDNIFSPNNFGYPTHTHFYPEKQDSSITRFVLLGDSFSAGTYLPVSMPDRLNDFLNDSANDAVFEVYPFAVDGGGLHNWHSIFFREIIPEFEFDAVLIPVFVDNLYRNFSIQHTTDSAGYFKRFTSIPKDSADFHMNYFPKMGPKWMVMPDHEIERKWNSRPEFKLYFLRMVLKLIKSGPRHQRSPEHWDKTSATIQDLRENLGINRFKRLEDLIFHCKNEKIPVILACIPEHFRVHGEKDPPSDQKDIQLIGEHFDVPWFNGYEIFAGMSEKEIKDCYLKYDGHWNQFGADLFASNWAKFILRSNWKK